MSWIVTFDKKKNDFKKYEDMNKFLLKTSRIPVIFTTTFLHTIGKILTEMFIFCKKIQMNNYNCIENAKKDKQIIVETICF